MGYIVVHEDGCEPIKRELASVIILDTDRGEPRELIAMRDTHRILSALSKMEARLVVNWLCEKFPTEGIIEVR